MMKKISLTEVEIMHLRDVYQAELEAAKKRIATLTSVLSKLGELKETQEQIVNKLLESTIEIAKKSDKKVIKKPGRRGRPPKAKIQVPAPEKVIEAKIIAKPKTKVVAPKIKGTKPKTVKPKTTKLKAEKPQLESAPASLKAEKATKVSAKKPLASKKRKTTRKPLKRTPGASKIKWNEFVMDAITATNSFIPSNEIVKAAISKHNLPETETKRINSSIATALTKLTKTDKKLVTYKKAGSRGSYYGLPEWMNESGELIPEMKEKI